METKLSFLKVVMGSFLTAIVYFLGGWDIALEILLLMIVLDYSTGVLKAIFNKKLNSEIGAKGIIKKVRLLSYSCCFCNVR